MTFLFIRMLTLSLKEVIFQRNLLHTSQKDFEEIAMECTDL